jgi:site-specific recombinase XerD
MNKPFFFKSIFALYFNGFIEMKNAMNFNIKCFRIFFLELDRFFVENNVTDVHITKNQISQWYLTQSNIKKTTLYHKCSILRQFCQYLCHLGQECYVPRLPDYVQSDFVPYIFTHKQMKLILEECDRLLMPDRRMDCILFALPALFRFLYSTGLRISEASSIKNEDVDLDSQRIILKKTKNQTQRLIPVNSSLLVVLKQYKEYRDKMPLKDWSAASKFFFVSPTGMPLSECAVLYWFKRVLRNCGISNAAAIRVHDIRHTAAVHSLVKMVNNGVDVYCALPILSVFLGHKTIESTGRYVRLTKEMYPEIINMEQNFMSFVFPKINVKKELDYDNN